MREVELPPEQQLLFFAEHGMAEGLIVPIGQGANVNFQNGLGWAPLHMAAKGNHVGVMKILLGANANINLQTERGWSPLHIVTELGHMEAMKILMDRGARILQGEDGWSPLHVAAAHGQAEAIAILLGAGANINLQTEQGWAPLHLAARQGHVQAMNALLLGQGVNVNLQNGQGGWSPLYIATEHSQMEAMKILLNRDANVNLHSIDGWFPLHLAAELGHEEAVELLIENGADVYARNHSGHDAEDIARHQGHIKLSNTLGRHKRTGRHATSPARSTAGPVPVTSPPRQPPSSAIPMDASPLAVGHDPFLAAEPRQASGKSLGQMGPGGWIRASLTAIALLWLIIAGILWVLAETVGFSIPIPSVL